MARHLNILSVINIETMSELFANISEFFNYAFIQKALITGSLIAILCSILSVILVPRRLSLIGDGLAHVTFGTAAIGLALKTNPFYVSLPVVVLSSLGILKIIKHSRLYGDSAIGIVSSMGIALGVIFASLGGGFNIDLFSFLFGSILTVTIDELYIAISLVVISILFIVQYYKEILSMTFDEDFAKVTGINTERINTFISIITAITVVLTMKIVGILLISALLIFPAVISFQLARGFKSAITIAISMSLISVNLGILLSFLINYPTGATIIVINFVILMIVFLFKYITAQKQTNY
ncbi:MAG: metal ABC transporter permease [Thermodesulfovibrionales bacterium]|nr:metal ABC transporter permease [Thermodesulfovibrionales bacterium]